MAYHGYRCANIPIVHGLSLPAVIKRLKSKQMVGLTISPHKLMEIRAQRLKKIGRPPDEPYAQLPHIRKEIDYAKSIFEKLKILVTDVTERAIEETATEIIKTLKI
jgi:regulator of PEP synthase PpsR (kinase-PPPase family)